MSAYPNASRRTSIYIAPLLIPALAIGAAALLLTAGPAQSSAGDRPHCKPERSLQKDFRRSEAVIIGRLIKIRPGAFFDRFTYRVERVYKEGNGRSSVGRRVKVRNWGRPCDLLPDRLGRSYGLFLEFAPFSGLNAVVSETRTRRAAERGDW